MQRTFLRPHYTLRAQLYTSYGIPALLTLVLVVLLACTYAIRAGRIVRDEASGVMREQVFNNMLLSARYMAEEVTTYFSNLEADAQLMAEFTTDRIAGCEYSYQTCDSCCLIPQIDIILTPFCRSERRLGRRSTRTVP